MMHRSIHHYRNLTNGLRCPCYTFDFKLVRIQSTHCEQKLWDRILHELGADFLHTLATGQVMVVHDLSEKQRETRACWQGLSWIRYATHRAWYPDDVPPKELSRNGQDVSQYWEHQWHDLDRPTVNLLNHYRKYVSGPRNSKLTSCYLKRTRIQEALYQSKTHKSTFQASIVF